MKNQPVETTSRLDFAERWLHDGLSVIEPASGLVCVDVDMSGCAALISASKQEGVPMTYAPLIVCAVARALGRHSDLRKFVAGTKKLHSETVDVCLSVAGDAAVTPVVIIENATNKKATEIAAELKTKIPAVRARDEQMFTLLRRWGWLLPFSFLRRGLLRFLLRQLWYRRRASGTFQVTILPGVDLVVPLLFNTAAALGVGGVRPRPAVIDGQVQVRLTAPFACAIDHKQWNGAAAAKFLGELKKILEHETNSLLELPQATPSTLSR